MRLLWGLLSIAQAEETNLRVWHAYRDDERIAFESVLEDYDQLHDNIKITTLAVPYESYATK
jgi:arabinogalactan oligomer/maltooligosaccharide transport system substrate-binding protein